MTSVHETMALLRGLSESEIRAMVVARLDRREVERWEQMTTGVSYEVLVLATAQALSRHEWPLTAEGWAESPGCSCPPASTR